MPSFVKTIKITGPAGAGIKSSGLLLSRILIAHGLKVRDYSEYPSLVRGGHNTYQVTFSNDEVYAPHFQVDILFSLLPKHWQQHQSEFTKKTLVFGDDAPLLLPLKDLSSQLGSALYSNTICLGVSAFIYGLNPAICHQIINKTFGNNSPNTTAFDYGYDYALKNFPQHQQKLPIIKNLKLKIKNSAIYDGNEAFGWGFINGKGSFYAAYPMTPASGAMHFLAGVQEKYKIQVLHPEDEIAAASLVAGASFAGARAATGTSGGGFALMTETVSFCGAANLGVVFYLVSRPGPATGLPTWTSQGDLLFAVNSGHGEFNKIVLAAGDQQDSYNLAITSLNLSAKYHLPVILLSDKFIGESGASLSDLSKMKAKIIENKLPLPGDIGKEYMANSYEHDSDGFSIEDISTIKKNTAARAKQLKKIIRFTPKPTFYFGSEKSTTLIVTWGSTKSTVLETLRILENPDLINLHFTTVWPINPEIKKLFAKFKKIIVVENNSTSQFVSLLKSQFDFNPDKVILKSDGRPFFPEELIKEFKKL